MKYNIFYDSITEDLYCNNVQLTYMKDGHRQITVGVASTTFWWKLYPKLINDHGTDWKWATTTPIIDKWLNKDNGLTRSVEKFIEEYTKV